MSEEMLVKLPGNRDDWLAMLKPENGGVAHFNAVRQALYALVEDPDYREFKDKILHPDLSGGDLTDYDLRGVDFSGIVGRKLKLTNANMENAQANEADLTEATPINANLKGTNFNNSTIKDADFKHATVNAQTNLKGVKGTPQNFFAVIVAGEIPDLTAIMPKSLAKFVSGKTAPRHTGGIPFHDDIAAAIEETSNLRVDNQGFKKFQSRLPTSIRPDSYEVEGANILLHFDNEGKAGLFADALGKTLPMLFPEYGKDTDFVAAAVQHEKDSATVTLPVGTYCTMNDRLNNKSLQTIFSRQVKNTAEMER